MGANAQTSVPTFTAGQVLTAQQLNDSARTGVPVAADASARDGLFGGTGEKTLAEGQLVYLEDSNIVQYYDGSNWQTLGPSAAAGLELVSSTTIGTTVASVTVTGAFSATYDNYLIVVAGGVASTTSRLRLTLGATATGYYWGGWYSVYATSDLNVNRGNNITTGWAFGEGTTGFLHAVATLQSPNLAKNTTITSSSANTTEGHAMAGYLSDTTQYTAFTITPSTGTLTGGTIKVYGYKN
jgi:hypothetical protein